MNPHVITAGGKRIDLPMGNPVVAAHVNNPNTLVERLLGQINNERLYDFALKGQKDLVMLDIGANIGLVSLYASDVCRRILAVEPTAQMEVLRAICGPFPNIAPMPMALAGHNGSAEFFLNDVNTTASSMANKYGAPTIVPTSTLTRLLDQNGLRFVDFCKVDIEGSELECLTQEQVDLCRHRIRAYFVEVHNCPNSTWEYKLGKLTQIFSHADYKHIRIRGDSLFACHL